MTWAFSLIRTLLFAVVGVQDAVNVFVALSFFSIHSAAVSLSQRISSANRPVGAKRPVVASSSPGITGNGERDFIDTSDGVDAFASTRGVSFIPD